MVAITAGGWLMFGLHSSLAVIAEPAESAPPSKELLLYLAEFGDRDERWVDPMSIVPEQGGAAVTQTQQTMVEPVRTPSADQPQEPPR